jgi:hypothetical protein
MRDEQFESIMDAWADRETASAPAMRPTAEMYRMVQAERKPSLPSLLFSRRAVLATAAASLVLLVVLYVGVYDPFMLFHPPPDREAVALRAGFPSEKGLVVRPTVVPPHRGQKKGAAFFEQLLFQFQQPESRYVIAADVRGPREESIVLTSADNYHLVLEPASENHVYVFQLTSADSLVQLFPNEGYHSAHNPLRQGQTYCLPAEPNWFYLSEGKGEQRLYIVASTRPLPELESLYAAYSQAKRAPEKQECLSGLLNALEGIEQTEGGEAVSWVFAFQHR